MVPVQQELLFDLLRVSLSTEASLSVSEDADWQGVFGLSVRQGVPGVAYDGLRRAMEMGVDVQGFDSPEMEELRYKWVGYGAACEAKYRQHERLISRLAGFYNENNYRMLLLKGYGLSLYYPVPNHRQSGDIDVAVFSNQWEPAPQEADLALSRKLGIRVAKSRYGHHSHFTVGKTLLENHYTFSNADGRGSSKYNKYEQLLQQYAIKDCKECTLGNNTFYLPSATFNALFLMWHTATHFCPIRASLKQLCDWMMFMSEEHDNVDWDVVQKAYSDYGMSTFANVVNGFLVQYLGMNETYYPGLVRNKTLEDKLLVDIFKPDDGVSAMDRILRYPRSNWKYQIVHESTWVRPFCRRVESQLFHRADTIEKTISEN